jgi:hypothetical protein
VADLAAVSAHLAGGLHRAGDVAPAGQRGDSCEQQRVVVDQGGRVEALGELLPETKRGCCISAAWNAMFEATPRITKAFSASRIRAMARSRVAPWQISLAIIES